jgi:hypothetical protein
MELEYISKKAEIHKNYEDLIERIRRGESIKALLNKKEYKGFGVKPKALKINACSFF